MRSKRKGACTDTLLKGFFDRLRTQLEKQEGVEMVESNLDAIVVVLTIFLTWRIKCLVLTCRHLILFYGDDGVKKLFL
ncbi:unnamed protein product [Brassica napus]|uniref:(rape) hypothetical protein n=1 Tax=Brassica napus TaxID=3708 RepID=A0A816PGX0_BRANA|nr:unnamed protein product [Brassica napus]